MLYRSFSNREKILFVFFGILLIVAVYYFLVFRTVTEQKSILQNTIYSQQEELTIIEAKFSEYTRMKSELETLPKMSELKPIGEYDNVRGVMEFLNTTMRQADDFSISFANVDASESFVRRTLSITFTCNSNDDARTIIDALFDAPYRSQAKNFNMTYNDNGGCTVNMTIVFFELLQQ